MSAPDREENIFASVIGLPPDQRGARLSELCSGEEDLRQRVEELLRLHDGASSFMAVPAGRIHQPTIELKVSPSNKPGDWIGRYKLLQPIGEGGCGIVFMAEQDVPVRRRVAVKVIKLGMDTKEVIARFEAERQALAMMDHPNIAKVLDAGATESGRPFFVMELVRGIKITDFCDEHNLSTEERLKLFIQVCQAIQHAHQKGVIHRDIKPSNILVTINEPGSPGLPKVIDFGIAKATQGRLTDQTLFTAFEQFIGTPAYMSPEQAMMTALDVDTRTDVYSLGVLLYELLTGRTPFDQKELLAVGLDEMRRTIREKEPPRPSTRLKTMVAEALTMTARHRHTDAPKLIHLLRGDLDWIVMKAMEKDRSRRYETATGLASDVQRYLRNDAVTARPPSALYRFQKSVRRHKTIYAAAAVTVLALVAGIIASTRQAIRATRAERAQTRLRQQAETMNRFLKVDLLEQATPDASAPAEMRNAMAAVLKRASSRLDQDAEIAAQSELEATLRQVFGGTFFKLGVLDEAERHLRRSVDLRRSALGPDDPRTLAAQEELAWLLVGGVRKFDEGETLSRNTWQARAKVLGPEDPDTLDSMDTYATALSNQKKYEEAEKVCRQCYTTRLRILGPTNTATLTSFGNLATLLTVRGDWAEAERMSREAIELHARLGLPHNRDSFAPHITLAMSLFFQNRLDDAINVLQEARPRVVKHCGPEDFATLHLQHILARVLLVANRLREAEPIATETLEVRRRKMPTHEGTGRTLLILGQILTQQNKPAQAEPLLQSALQLFREHYAKKLELAAQAANWLGAIQTGRSNYFDAETLLLSDTDQFFAPTADMSIAERTTCINHIIQLYERWGKPDKAATWQKRLADLDDLGDLQRGSQ